MPERTLSDLLRAALREAIELIEEAHDSHIYDRDDEHPDDCAYCATVAAGKAILEGAPEERRADDDARALALLAEAQEAANRNGYNGPVASYHEFATAHQARTYRHEHGTGGWIFEPANGGPSILFPPQVTPYEIFYHPLTRGQAGSLLAN